MTLNANKPLSVLVVEDEAPARDLLVSWLGEIDELQIVGAADSLKTAKCLLTKTGPDVVFLDIELPDGIGFTLFDDLSDRDRPFVVFTTAYDAYAVEAFRINAVDYLVKPFDRMQLRDAVERITRRLRSSTPTPSGTEDQFKNILRIKHRGQTVFLMASDIEYLESEDYYTAVHAKSQCYLSRTSLKIFRRDLAKFGFVQVHRSYIVNIAHIAATKRLAGGDFELHLHSGRTIKMSRRYKGEFEVIMKTYSLESPPAP